MAFVNFYEFKQVNEARVLVNNAMVALLAGSRLASHTLRLTAGSPQLLPQIFPQVSNIDRFNLVPDKAKELLDEADTHVAAVSLPYALSVHEDFTMVVIEMVRSRGTKIVVPGKRKLGPATMHESLFQAVGYPLPDTTLEIFHILREMRNSQIHEGGRANSRLLAQLSSMSPEANIVWRNIVGEDPQRVVQRDRVTFALGHIFLVFAVIKMLSRDINRSLQSHWSRHEWAEILVRDYVALTSNMRNSSSWRRSLAGLARLEFSPLALTDSELEKAARATGNWTAPQWS